MNLSLLTFSMIPDVLLRKLDAEKLCRICTDNGIDRIDPIRDELKLYGKEKLKKAMQAASVSCGCLIANVDFLGEPHKANAILREVLTDCRELGTDQLMIVPGQALDNRKKRVRSLSRKEMMEEAVRFFRLSCNMDISAAELSYSVMSR